MPEGSYRSTLHCQHCQGTQEGAHFRWKERQRTCVLWTDEYKFTFAFEKGTGSMWWERWTKLLSAKDGAVCDGMGVNQFPWHVNTHMCEDTNDAGVFFVLLETTLTVIVYHCSYIVYAYGSKHIVYIYCMFSLFYTYCDMFSLKISYNHLLTDSG